uniref:Arf-GAP domain-containing protein n=1 Tax=Xiphophorus couchianus TaxID=32473 RepID=A0A3B5M6K8_9TELE
MRNAIGEALSNNEVVEQIWREPSNSFCADCGAPQPDWAAINLCVVICKQCAGEHRGLGPSISKVRSLKMDKKIWTEELIQVNKLKIITSLVETSLCCKFVSLSVIH